LKSAAECGARVTAHAGDLVFKLSELKSGIEAHREIVSESLSASRLILLSERSLPKPAAMSAKARVVG
jgi:hypothetical protein